MRILIQSNAEWAATGYGVQSKHLAPGLESLGHTVGMFPFWGLQGGLIQYNGRVNYPLGIHEWGNDIFASHAQHFKADLVISLMDTWVMHEDYGSIVKWIPWVPLDHSPAPQGIVVRMKKALRTVAFSRFGRDELVKAGINADYIPHGIDVEGYYPLNVDKAQLKVKLGFPPDCFLVGMVAANKGWPCRKCFPENFEAFAAFARKHPDARLYCHSEPTNKYGGPDLQGMGADFGINSMMRFPNPYLLNLGFPDTVMNEIFNAFDVLLAPSMGEGFGIPTVESQACGIPVIVTDFAASAELVAAGWKVPIARKWWTPLNSFQALPNIDGIIDALENAYQADRKAMVKRAREFAMDYRWEKVIGAWGDLLKLVEPLTYQHDVKID